LRSVLDGGFGGCGRLRSLVHQVHFLRRKLLGLIAVQGIDAGNRHSAQLRADFDDRATVGRAGRGTNFDNDEVADIGCQTADIEVSVSAVDGFDGKLPGNGNTSENSC